MFFIFSISNPINQQFKTNYEEPMNKRTNDWITNDWRTNEQMNQWLNNQWLKNQWTNEPMIEEPMNQWTNDWITTEHHQVFLNTTISKDCNIYSKRYFGNCKILKRSLVQIFNNPSHQLKSPAIIWKHPAIISKHSAINKVINKWTTPSIQNPRYQFKTPRYQWRVQ